MEREGLSLSGLTVRPCSNRGLQPILDVRESKGYKVPRRLAALVLEAKQGSPVIEVMKVCRVREPAVLRQAERKSPPAVEDPAALRAAADLASKR